MADLASCQMCLLSILGFVALCYTTSPHLHICGETSYLRGSRSLRGLKVKVYCLYIYILGRKGEEGGSEIGERSQIQT